jgi:hypothetical protein
MKRVAVVLAAATVTGIGIASTNAATNTPTTAPSLAHSITSPLHKAMVNSSVVSPAAHIDSVVASATDYALSPGHMDHLVSLLDQSSRNRIRSSSIFSENSGKQLDAQIEQVSTLWKQKYGHAFSTRTESRDIGTSFASLQIGTVGKNANLAAEVRSAAGNSAMPIQSKTNQTTASLRMRRDESIALADIKSADGLSDLRVPLACKNGGSWRILAPSTLTAEKLRANLSAEFASLTATHAQWPASETEAYRLVTHRVLMALQDKAAPAAKHAAANQATNVTRQQASAAPAQSIARATPESNTGHWWQFWRW